MYQILFQELDRQKMGTFFSMAFFETVMHLKSSFSSLKLQTFKWQEYINWQRKLREARASSAALKGGINEISDEAKPPESKWRAFFQRSPREDTDTVVKNNVYDKGFFNNLYETIFPLSTRSSILKAKSKSGWEMRL